MTQYVNYDPASNGKILSINPNGQKEPMHYPQIEISDDINTAGMMVDITKNPPVLIVASDN